jgi:hypothetical protein
VNGYFVPKQEFIGEPTQPCPARLSKPAHNVTRANDFTGLAAPLRNFPTFFAHRKTSFPAASDRPPGLGSSSSWRGRALRRRPLDCFRFGLTSILLPRKLAADLGRRSAEGAGRGKRACFLIRELSQMSPDLSRFCSPRRRSRGGKIALRQGCAAACGPLCSALPVLAENQGPVFFARRVRPGRDSLA